MNRRAFNSWVGQTFPSARTRAFTLIELLIVIAIISVLAGLLMGAISAARTQANINLVKGRIKGRIKLLQVGLASYENDFGDYPTSDGDDGIKGAANLYAALLTDRKNGPYVKPSDLPTINYNGDTVFADAWKKPIYYIHHRFYHNEPPNKHEYRLISGGPDGIFQGGDSRSDDIVNWNKEKPEAE
jgi:prepilin-type N-terminal cleavage/methylation domain-containing protein